MENQHHAAGRQPGRWDQCRLINLKIAHVITLGFWGICCGGQELMVNQEESPSIQGGGILRLCKKHAAQSLFFKSSSRAVTALLYLIGVV